MFHIPVRDPSINPPYPKFELTEKMKQEIEELNKLNPKKEREILDNYDINISATELTRNKNISIINNSDLKIGEISNLYKDVKTINHDISSSSETPDIKSDKDYIYHIVIESDTLIRLSVHYDVSVNIIKRHNQFKLLGDNLDYMIGEKIRIPYKGIDTVPLPTEKSDAQSILNYRFISLNGCTFSEAKYYLSEHNNDFTRATAAYKDDQAWAKAHSYKGDNDDMDNDENSCCSL